MTTPIRRASHGPLLLRYIVLAVLASLGAAAVYWMKQHEPTYSQRTAPIPVEGKVGERVVARALAAQVPGNRPLLVGNVLGVPGSQGGQIQHAPTEGIWLGVPVVRELILDSGEISQALQAEDGSRYSPVSYSFRDGDFTVELNGQQMELAELNLAGRKLGAGLPQQGYLYFEVPPEKLAGMHLLLFEGRVMMPNDNVIVIDLGIDAAAADELHQNGSKPLATFVISEQTS